MTWSQGCSGVDVIISGGRIICCRQQIVVDVPFNQEVQISPGVIEHAHHMRLVAGIIR